MPGPQIIVFVDGAPAWTTAMVADRLGVDVATARSMIRRRRIAPVAHLDRRTPLYSASDITGAFGGRMPR